MPRVIDLREAAHAAGEFTFFTGRACKKGHIGPRYVSSGACVQCAKRFKSIAEESLWAMLEFRMPVAKTLVAAQRRELDRYLTHAALHWLKTKGVSQPSNAVDVALQMATDADKVAVDFQCMPASFAPFVLV